MDLGHPTELSPACEVSGIKAMSGSRDLNAYCLGLPRPCFGFTPELIHTATPASRPVLSEAWLFASFLSLPMLHAACPTHGCCGEPRHSHLAVVRRRKMLRCHGGKDPAGWGMQVLCLPPPVLRLV